MLTGSWSVTAWLLLLFICSVFASGMIVTWAFNSLRSESKKASSERIWKKARGWPAEKRPPTPKLVAEALALLETSPTGAPVARFLKEQKIPVEPFLSDEAGGIYASREETIYLSPRAGSCPISIACILAHEGLHAMQELDWRMEPCVEREHQAYFLQFAVYHELLNAGHVPAKEIKGVGLHVAYRQFRFWTLQSGSGAYDERATGCLTTYRQRPETAENFLTASIPERLVLAPISGLMRCLGQIRARQDERRSKRNLEPIAHQLRQPRYFFRRRALARTRRIHSTKEEWRNTWIRDHRAALTNPGEHDA